MEFPGAWSVPGTDSVIRCITQKMCFPGRHTSATICRQNQPDKPCNFNSLQFNTTFPFYTSYREYRVGACPMCLRGRKQMRVEEAIYIWNSGIYWSLHLYTPCAGEATLSLICLETVCLGVQSLLPSKRAATHGN